MEDKLSLVDIQPRFIAKDNKFVKYNIPYDYKNSKVYKFKIDTMNYVNRKAL